MHHFDGRRNTLPATRCVYSPIYRVPLAGTRKFLLRSLLPPCNSPAAALTILRKLFIALVVAGSAALVAAVACGIDPTGAPTGPTGFAKTVELKTYDVRTRLTARPEAARRDIVLVTIDEDSIRKLEPIVGRWPWPRLVHAQLVNYLARGSAKVVGYDVLFSERDRSAFSLQGEQWTGAESDQAFVEAVARAGNVILAADATREEADAGQTAPGDAKGVFDLLSPAYRLTGVLEERPVITPPFDDLARAARGIGHSFFPWDADGPLRRSVPFIRVGGRAVPSLAVGAATVAGGIAPERIRLNGTDLQLDEARLVPLIAGRTGTLDAAAARPTRRALVRFTGPVTRRDGKPTYDEYSFYSLFYSEQQLLAGERPLVDPAVFRGKVVMVGVTAAGLHDVFAVPFTQGKMPGVEIHANVVDNILSAHFMVPAPRLATVASIVAAASIVGLLAAFTSAWWTIGGTALILCVLAAAGTALFARGVWLPLVAPMAAASVAASGGVAYQYFVEGREKRRLKRIFSRMVAPDVYAHLLADPASTRLGGERRDMTVLFSDIRGFTTVSESRRPEEIVSQLNEYFTRMVEVVFRHHGTVDKFVGDMVMALFGAPVGDPDSADHAVGAALDMLAALDDLNAAWSRQGRPCLQIGIGINSGEMVAGNVGSEQIMSYTVIGDAVNLGSRLESLNKQYGTSIIISDDTRERLKGQYHVDPLGEVTVKGKTRPVGIFQVRSDRGQQSAAVGQGDGK